MLSVKQPLYIRLLSILLLLSLSLFILYIGNQIIMPILFSVFFAILLRPIVVFLTKRAHLPNIFAILTAILLFLIFVGAILFFIFWQISNFMSDWPRIKEALLVHYHGIQQWIKYTFNLSYYKQETYIKSFASDSLNSGGAILRATFSSFSEMLFDIVLIPIYIFLVLLYRNLFKKFLINLIPAKDHPTMVLIIAEIKVVVQHYIAGLMIEMCIVSVMTTIGFLIVGVPYAPLLGVMAGVLNLVPYIGIFCAGILAMLIALIHSNDFSGLMGVLIVNVIVQLFDNNFLVPKIVASKVKVNALMSIVAVLVGGVIGGVMGMFLAIPVIAILKTIFDRVEALKAWGILLGDELPTTITWRKVKIPDVHAGT